MIKTNEALPRAYNEKHLIKFLKDMVTQQEEKSVPVEFEHEEVKYKVEAISGKSAKTVYAMHLSLP